MSTVNGFQVGSETLKYNYESLDNYNTPNFSTSSSKTYAVGDYVMYNGKLYKCTTATTGGTWVSSNWTLAVLSDDVRDINNALNGSIIPTITWYDGYFTGANVFNSNSSYRHTEYIPIKDIYFPIHYNIKSIYSVPDYILFDENKNYLDKHTNTEQSLAVIDNIVYNFGNASYVVFETFASYNAVVEYKEIGSAKVRSLFGKKYDEGDIDGLFSDIRELASEKTAVVFSDPTEKKYIDLNKNIGDTISLTPLVSSATQWRYAIIDCSPGQMFEIDVVGGTSPRAYGFIDSANKLLEVADSGAYTGIVTAPQNTIKAIFNDKNNGTVYAISGVGRVDTLEYEMEASQTEIQDIKAGTSLVSNDVICNQFIKELYLEGANPNTTYKWYLAMRNNSEYGYGIAIAIDGTTTIVCYLVGQQTEPNNPVIIPEYRNSGITGYAVLDWSALEDGSNKTYNIPLNDGVKKLFNSPILFDLLYGEKAKLELPASYDLVVGDTFQLFYKGIVKAANTDCLFVRTVCTKGSNYERLFEITPSTVENLTATVSLYDFAHNLLDEKTTTLKIKAKPSSPLSNKTVLCVGDSLTTNGEWPKELYRRLTGSGGTPAGDDLDNIQFIGTRISEGVHYEGYGGWTFNSYNTANVSSNAKIITCTHDKTEAEDQHSIYRDGVNKLWKLETIETNQIKIIAVNGEGTDFPATGTLTWVSGGTNHSNIVYTASQDAPGNPFWNSDQDKVDFASYATLQGVSSIDYVVVLLGWNDAGKTESYYKTEVQTFITNVHTDFPDAKIILMGLEIPALNGLGKNYGASSIYSDYYRLVSYVFDLDKWYSDIASGDGNVYGINVSGQFDTEYNMQTGVRTVNTRNSETEIYQTNGVHPANSGYMQIADAAYRSIASLL